MKRLSSLAFSIASLVLVCESADAVVIFNRVVIENGKQRLVFIRGKKNPSDPVGGIGLKSISRFLATPTSAFNTVFSPMFRVELRSSADSASFPPIDVPAPELEFALLPLDQLELDEPTPNTARLTWRDIPVPGSSQLLTVTLRCRLRPTDLKAVWNFDATVTTGPYYIYAVRAPYLGFTEIRNEGSDDWFLIPMTSGQIVPDPLNNGNNFPERDVEEGTVSDAYFTYPGNVMSQYMAYYDSAEGFYMAAEDGAGVTKNLYFNKAAPSAFPNKVRMYTYITHFNRGLKPTSGQTIAELEQDLRSFALAPDLGYEVVTDVFQGDWLDATGIYRDWVQGNSAPFIRRGPLLSRADLDNASKTTTYVLRWGLPLEQDDVDWESEYADLQDTLIFYDSVRARYDPLNTIDFQPFVLLGGYELTPDGPGSSGGGWDDISFPLRDGVVELVHEMRSPSTPGDIRARAVSMNRDTTGISVDAAIAPVGLQKGIMRHTSLEPIEGKVGVRYRSCIGSDWLRAHRTSLIIQTLTDSKVGGAAGFNAVATTGTGNFSFVEYAPMVDDSAVVDRDAHNHGIGGGSYQTAGWLQLAADIKQAAAAAGTSAILLGMEHTPETMIEEYLLVGRSFAPPLDVSLSGVHRTIDHAVPVPIFTHLYHDFNLHPSKPPSFSTAVQFYVDDTHPIEEMLHVRLRYAQFAMHGRMLRSQVAKEDPAVIEYEGPISQLDPALRDEHELFAALATLRGSLIEYLVYGKAQRDPVVLPSSATDTVTLDFNLGGQVTSHVFPRVVASGWRDEINDNYGFVLVNFTPSAGTVRFSFLPSHYGLDPGESYDFQERVGLTTWVNLAVDVDPTTRFTSPEFTVPPLENATDAPPWRIFRIRPRP